MKIDLVEQSSPGTSQPSSYWVEVDGVKESGTLTIDEKEASANYDIVVKHKQNIKISILKTITI